MKIFVFGGSGFIGSRVVDCLSTHGHQVVTLVRDQKKAAHLKRQGVTVHTGDLTAPGTLPRLIDGSDTVINLAIPAFLGRLGDRRAAKLADQVLTYARNIVDAVAECGSMPLIVTEGTLAHCDGGPDWIDETAAYNLKGYARLGRLSIPYYREAEQEKGSWSQSCRRAASTAPAAGSRTRFIPC